MSSIFSTYSTDENRVTSSVMAVIGALSLRRTERLLGAMLGQSEFELVRFQNQPSHGAPGVPDYEIASNCRMLVETKIKAGAVDIEQIKRHLNRLDLTKGSDREQYLLVLTPDPFDPIPDQETRDKRIVWTSFALLNQALEELLADLTEVISEREAYLLRELQKMLANEGLTIPPKDTVVVAARHAWPMYHQLSAYVCQANRAFAHVQHLAFYADQEIKPLVPTIRAVHDEVVFDSVPHDPAVQKVVDMALSIGTHERGFVGKVFILSGPTDTETEDLGHAVTNDLPSAFTMGQRYARLVDIKAAEKTSQLH
ncbi:MAG: hypothetical protein M1305_03030 [Candidatus Marsarchaeota archaeon]|nr:hypothetical protein [Candidatus Marsarchaeota archaeon]